MVERKRKPFCKRGHEIAVVGRYGTGECKRCNLMRVYARRKAHPEEYAAACRRHYQRTREQQIKRAALWNKAHPERRRELVRENRERYKGVNFWVMAASKSR